MRNPRERERDRDRGEWNGGWVEEVILPEKGN